MTLTFSLGRSNLNFSKMFKLTIIIYFNIASLTLNLVEFHLLSKYKTLFLFVYDKLCCGGDLDLCMMMPNVEFVRGIGIIY